MAVQETIDLTTVIDHIDSHMPFDIAYVTADKKRGTGGQIKQHKGWVKCDLSSQPEMVLRKNKIFMAEVRSPNHQDHKTKNIMNPVTREIRKLHLRLICVFNNKRVV